MSAKTAALNQTYGWGTESGDSYGSGTGYDSGVGTNQSSQELDPYSAVSTKTAGLAQGTHVVPPPSSGPGYGYTPYDSSWNISDNDVYPYNANTPHAPALALAAPVPPVAAGARPSPAHLVMAFHACLFGAVAATLDLGGRALKGEDVGADGGWIGKWRSESEDAAAAVSPVSGYVVSKQIMGGL